MEKKELVIFESADQEVSLSVQTDGDTMWLTQKQMEQLFDVRQATISEHISNILDSGELDETSIGFSDRSTGGRKRNDDQCNHELYSAIGSTMDLPIQTSYKPTVCGFLRRNVRFGMTGM